MTADSHAIVVDLGYGDAGKGTTVDWLCARRGYRTVVRFNGGAQAAHNVVTVDGRHHTFAQFGAGSFTPGVVTHLSDRMLVDPLALAAEADHLTEVGVPDAMERLSIDRRALITTPWHRAANRARELSRGGARHGSCGMGIGETAQYGLTYPGEAPTVGDCRSPASLHRTLTRLSQRLGTEFDLENVPSVAEFAAVCSEFGRAVSIVDGDHIGDLLRQGPAVFEGAQGILLDEWAGFHPYTTWSTTTSANAEAILAEAGQTAGATRLGVLRTYTTRHGAGPLITHSPEILARLPERHNGTGPWQGAFRAGHFDAVAHRYALAATGGVDALVLTHLDAVDATRLSICDEYRRVDGSTWQPQPPQSHDLERQQRLTDSLATVTPQIEPGPQRSEDWPEAVSKLLGAPVAVTSHGPTAADKLCHDF